MGSKTYGPWKGVDLRDLEDSADPKTVRTATNVDLATNGTFEERGGLRRVTTVDADSRGLYSVGGWLRCAIAAGHSKPASIQATVPILYDALGDGTIYGVTTIDKVTSVTSWDADGAAGVYPAIVIKRTAAAGGLYEIHWIKDTPVPASVGGPPPYVPSTDTVTTKVALPFTPGSTIIKIQEKVVAIDNLNGAIRFCSTVNGITDWTTEADAGFLPVIKHATGDRTLQGLSFYDDLMAVMFSDSIQLWQMHPDPAQHRLVRVLNGPGVQAPGSVVNVKGDLFYFSRGTFSSLSRSANDGQLVDGDIGAPITPDTTLLTADPLGLWSQGSSAYFCFFGATVWRYMHSPSSKLFGWTKYELPVTVDAAVEHLGKIYVRAGADIYRFEKGYADGSTFTVESQALTLGTPGKWKDIPTMDVTLQGTAAVKCLPDMRDNSVVDHLFTLNKSSAGLTDLPVLENSEAPAFRFTGALGGDTPFKLHRFSVHYAPGIAPI